MAKNQQMKQQMVGKAEEKKHYYSSGLLTDTATSGHAVSDEYDDDCDTDCAEHSQDDHSNLVREQTLLQRVICTPYTQWSHWRTQRRVRGFGPPLNIRQSFNCVFPQRYCPSSAPKLIKSEILCRKTLTNVH